MNCSKMRNIENSIGVCECCAGFAVAEANYLFRVDVRVVYTLVLIPDVVLQVQGVS